MIDDYDLWWSLMIMIDDYDWWLWFMIDDYDWRLWLVNMIYDYDWWLWLLILIYDYDLWLCLMIMIDDYDWWLCLTIMIFRSHFGSSTNVTMWLVLTYELELMRETNSSKAAHTHYSLLHELDGSLLESFIQPLLGSVPHLCSKHKKVNTFVSYNPLSLRKACRTHDILSELKQASVVAMQGTRLRQSNNLDMHVSNVGNFRVFHCGYPT